MSKKPFTMQVVRAGEVTYTEPARTFAEAMKLGQTHLAPDVEVRIWAGGFLHATMRQPQWRQVLHSALAARDNIDIPGNDPETEVR